jgi:signal transduction histidine kinase
MPFASPLLAPPSDDFIALCQVQMELLREQMEADRSAVYLTEPLSSNLIPVVVYPPFNSRPRSPERMRSLKPAREKADLLTTVKLEDLSNLWSDKEARDSHRLFLPLTDKEYMVGLLVITREKRPWQSWELTQMEKITQTLAFACVLDRQLREERYYRQWERQRLDTFLHQIRNPLTALKTFGKLLLKRLLPEEGHDPAVTGILRESDRVRDLIAEFEAQIDQKTGYPATIEVPLLQAQSSPTAFLLPAGSNKLDLINISDILDPLLLSAQAVAKERNIELEVIYGDKIAPIQANAPGLREVFSNLIDNALKYTPSGGKVTIETQSVKNSVEVVIKDTGYGIPIADQGQIFQRNYRGVQTQGDIPGTGLGLAIAKELITSMGGAIDFISPNPDQNSSPYPGTVFRVRIGGVNDGSAESQ